jgi:hypothetical protein
MSSIVNRLTEGVVNRDMRAESHALLSKWKKTGLLEGLEGERKQNTMARLLENQAKELLREQTSMGAGDVEGFAAVAFPIVRRVFAGLIANDLVSVQPMSLPSGLIFFLDFVYSANIGASGTMVDRFGNTADKSIYGTDRVGSQITGGVGLVGSLAENLSGPRDMVGYAYGSPETLQLVTASATNFTVGERVAISAITQAQKKLIKFDPDVLAETSNNLFQLTFPESGLTRPDLDNLSAFDISGSSVGRFGDTTNLTDVNTKLIRRLTSTDGTDVSFFFVSSHGDALTLAVSTRDDDYAHIEHPTKDGVEASTSAAAGAIDTYSMLLEANAEIPEIDIKVDSIAVTAQTKKLKAKWTPELGQDLNAYHNLDAEVELTSILSEQIALEIDREILADLVNGATAATRYWSRAPGLFVDSTGAELGATSAAPDFTGTVSEWYETLVETINDVSAQIHRKTLRGGANFVVCSPEVANILEFTAGFRASVTHDDEKGSIGALRVGSLSKKFDVIVDPYFLRNVVLVGRRGASFLESGYVYAPYVPLQTTPTIFGPEDFVPRKGVMTRYAKKMVRPDMYGLVVVRGLLGESGS